MWTDHRIPGDVELVAGRTGEGPDPVVAIHGISSYSRAFNAVARHLEHPSGMVAMDLRGRGDSEKPESGYGLAAHTADVLRVLDHFGLESAVIAGHSMGGFVGTWLALHHPQRVRALVLLDGGWPRVESDVRSEEEVDRGLQRVYARLDTTFESPEAYLEFWFPGQDLTLDDLDPDLAAGYRYELEEVEGGYRPKASAAAAREDSVWVTDRAPTAEELREVRCPVYLVRPTAGFFPDSPPIISEEMKRAMADALNLRSDTIMPGANHYSMLYDPYAPEVARKISEAARL
jgi:lipase